MTTLTGPRLALTPFHESDRDDVTSLLNAPDAWGNRQIDPDPLRPLTDREVAKSFDSWLADEISMTYAIRSGTVLVGYIGEGKWWDAMRVDVSIFIGPDHRGEGYGTEAATVLLDHLFATAPAEVASCWVPDWGDRGFAIGIGFRPAGRMRRAGIRDGRWFDMLAFDLLRSEWRERRGD